MDLELPGLQLLGDLPGEAGLKQSAREARRLQLISSPARGLVFQACMLQMFSETKTTRREKESFGWGALGLLGFRKF